MGIAEATALVDFSASFLESSGDGDMPSPAGVDMLSENMKSSRFIASGCSATIWSELFLNCAMPLGADVKGVELIGFSSFCRAKV